LVEVTLRCEGVADQLVVAPTHGCIPSLLRVGSPVERCRSEDSDGTRRCWQVQPLRRACRKRPQRSASPEAIDQGWQLARRSRYCSFDLALPDWCGPLSA